MTLRRALQLIDTIIDLFNEYSEELEEHGHVMIPITEEDIKALKCIEYFTRKAKAGSIYGMGDNTNG